jgi:hypothetical protein
MCVGSVMCFDPGKKTTQLRSCVTIIEFFEKGNVLKHGTPILARIYSSVQHVSFSCGKVLCHEVKGSVYICV